MTHRLRELGLDGYYRSGTHSLIDDFYRPCLRASVSYDRAVGYFTSGSLAAAAAGLRPFLDRPESRMRLIASPQLTHEDVEAIERGYELRTVVERSLITALAAPVPDPIRARLELLTWLVQQERLDIKIAVVADRDRIGMYHEKVGVFTDADGDFTVFSGSANESIGGLLANFESIEVYRSWVAPDEERAHRRRQDFEALWNDETLGLRVMPFPDAVRATLIQRYSTSGGAPPGDPDQPGLASAEGPSIPNTVVLRDYQVTAISSWFAAGGRGIWEMATGTGKTFTALAALTELYRVHREKQLPLFVVISVPFLALADQWTAAARAFGLQPMPCHGNAPSWRENFDHAVLAYRAGSLPFGIAIAVNATFAGPDFQRRLNDVPSNLLVIADEVHNMGARHLQPRLPSHATYRLGLSATPDRHMDPEGTAAIKSYFGEPVFSLGLKEAVERRALVPYRYHVHLVELDEDEQDQYAELTDKIARAAASGELDDALAAGTPDSYLKTLLFERARLVGNASGKVPALEAALASVDAELHHALVYCAPRDRRTEARHQLDQVVALLGNKFGLRVNTYTSEESSALREEILQRFASGELQALAAIRCLDEGVDIPEAHLAFFLASTTNPRQFVQRRGRVLRPAPGKTRAEIHDFLVVPPDVPTSPGTRATERRLVARELSRVIELSDASLNGPEVLASLLPLREKYGLLALGEAQQ